MKLFIKSLLLAFAFFILFSVEGRAQTKSNLYIAMNDLNSDTWQYLNSINVKEVKVVFGQYIYRKNGFDLMSESLIREIKKLFPDENSSGIGMLDWEGPAYEALKGSKNSNSYKRAVASFNSAVILAKKIRPNVKWGYFGLPFKKVFGTTLFTTNELNKFNQNIVPILKNCDVLFPSCYNSYMSTFSSDVQSIQNDLLRALKLGVQLNKPVMALVWHRYSNSRSPRMFKLIPESKFVTLVNSLKNVTYQNTSISGIIWWGGDTRFYNRGDGKIRQEAKDINSFKIKYNNMIKKYSKDLSNN